MNSFTIQISAFKPPFMREKMTLQYTVCKQRVGYKYQYCEYRYNKQALGRVQRAYDKAVIRFHKHYAGINHADERVRSYAPYAIAPNAIVHEMSERWVKYGADKKFLKNIVSRLTIKYNTLMCLAQQGKYKLIQDALYDVHKAYHELQSMCRPHNHEVVYKGYKNPLTANLK